MGDDTFEQRSKWQPSGPSDPDLFEEPSDEDAEWDPGEKPPASWQNWFHSMVVSDLGDLIRAIVVNSGTDSGNLRPPVDIGVNGLGQINVEVVGAGDLAVTFNAEYDSSNDRWDRIDDSENNPFMIVFNGSLSGLTGIASDDLGDPAAFTVLQAASIDGTTDEITWEKADINAGSLNANLPQTRRIAV